MTAAGLLLLVGCGTDEDVAVGSTGSTAPAPEETTNDSSPESNLPPPSSTITTPPPDTSGFHIAAVEPAEAINGEPITVTGAGCLDPATGSADGLTVEVRFGAGYVSLPGKAANADGTFEVEGSLPDGVLPDWQSAVAGCVRDARTERGVDVIPESAPVDVWVRSPYSFSLTPSTVQPGGVLTVTAECPPGSNSLGLSNPDLPELFEPGSSTIDVTGTTASGTVTISAKATSGDLLVNATCMAPRAPATRGFDPVYLTIVDPAAR